MYFLNYLCQTGTHCQHLVDSSNALFSKSLTLPTVYAFILSILLIALMGFPWLIAASYTLTDYECTRSQLYDTRDGWIVVPQCSPLDSGRLKCRFQLTSHRLLCGSIFSCNAIQSAVGMLKTIKNLLQMFGKPSASILALDLTALIRIWKRKIIADQPCHTRVVLHTIPNYVPYSMQWSTLWLVSLVMSIRAMLN